MKKVLIIDDEPDNLEILAEMLRNTRSFEPITAKTGREGTLLAIESRPDVILLDVNMPDMDGFQVCSRLREQPSTRQIPIIMLTSASNLDSRVKGLDLGADDYISKPFQFSELMARIRARVRRHDLAKKEEAALSVGNLKADPKSYQVWVDEEEVRLTNLEFKLLMYFLERPNQVIPRNRLLGDLWPDAVVTDRTVDTHMANLRKKIKNFDHPLTTVYGGGYILKTAA